MRSLYAVVAVHLVVVVAHTVAHEANGIHFPTLAPNLFVLGDTVLAPLVAAALGFTGRERAAALLLALAMGGALIFGVWNHFMVGSPDHVAHALPGFRGALFQGSAIALFLLEGAGCWVGIRLLRSLPRPLAARRG
jgi:hypothetical protein